MLATDPSAGRQDFHQLWRQYALRRRSALIVLALWPVGCIVLFAVSGYWLHDTTVGLTTLLVWALLAIALVWYQGEFRCPGCHRRYGALGHKRGRTNWTRGIFDAACSNCKLRKFEREQ